ncbi:C-type lectin 37Da-like [Bradysia coprophila]|uniref:C-type lectin 37Da-like n=1 Tax=Bradysia coprophila TaxID=38358 RepID=UPI00187D8694|nr:C-type lectin 37Da-like [Bradysia coprophila]
MVCLKSLVLLFIVLNVTLTFGQNAPVQLLNKEFKIQYFAKMTWFNAHLSCLDCGGQLASIETEVEQKYVEGLIHDLDLQSKSFWTAGTDLANEGIFNWFTTGDVITYANFAPLRPDNKNGTEHCIVLFGAESLKWNDFDCNSLAYFICENKPKCYL